MAKLVLLESPKPSKEKKRKLSDKPNTSEYKKQKKDKKKKITEINDPGVEDDDLTQNTTEVKMISPKKGKKRKLSDSESPKILTLVKKLKTKSTNNTNNDSIISQEAESENHQESTKTNVSKLTAEEAMEKYPVLKDEELIKKFLAVPMTNNQKGRIRQRLRDFFHSASSENDPELIHRKLAAILCQDALTDSDLKQVRILHNMLKTAVQVLAERGKPAKKPNKKKKKKSKETEDTKSEAEAKPETEEEVTSVDTEEKKTIEKAVKIKGPKRYVVFVGNLPYDADKDSIMRHFSSIVGKIRDVRIPKKGENKKGGIAYLEIVDEASYQMALSRHHSMLGNRRINVLYTTAGKGKIDKNEAKGKTAKLLALHKSGKLLGSTPLGRKRSARRKKQRDAEAKAQSQQ